ncbi:hypothetical protein LCGC14_0928720, partial [marine sediment metagenome]
EHFQAFASLNYPQLIESGVHLTVFKEYLLKVHPRKKFKVHKIMDRNVAILKLFPGLAAVVLESILNIPNLRGLILETYGAGNAPNEPWLVDILRKGISQGIHIVNVTQCSGGSVQMGHYETSEQLKNLQVINGKDITTEAAMAKLMYLLGSNISESLFKTVFETPLRGEMQ